MKKTFVVIGLANTAESGGICNQARLTALRDEPIISNCPACFRSSILRFLNLLEMPVSFVGSS